MSAIRKTKSARLKSFVVLFKNREIMAIRAYTWSWSVGGDQLLFQLASGEPSLFRGPAIDCVVSASDLDELPAFLKMQNDYQRILERLEALERAR